MEIPIQILKNRINQLEDIKKGLINLGKSYDEKDREQIDDRIKATNLAIKEVSFCLQRLEIEGRRREENRRVEEKEFQDSLGRFNG